MKILILSTSLNPESKSRIMAVRMHEEILSVAPDVSVELIDLQDYPLPFCDAATVHDDPNAVRLRKQILESDAILVTTAIYNYNISSSLKNLVELTHSAWSDKLIGFACAAGGSRSYMSIMSFANSLLLDYRCWVIPRFVYATTEHFDRGELIDDEIHDRLIQLVKTAIRMAPAVASSHEAIDTE